MNVDFSDQDLRDRSFRGQDLRGANFHSADLRGCDFSQAQLTRANFQNIKTGHTLKQVLPFILLAIATALPLLDAISRLIFAALGQTSEDSGWTYVLVLYGALGIAGLGGKWLDRLSAAAAAAIVGFFHAGSWTQNDPRFAAIGAIVCGLLAARLGNRGIALTTARTIARYGLAFLLATIALNHLSTQNPWGLFWGFLSMLYTQFAITALLALLRQFQRIGGTSFQSADLTHATIDHARLSPNTDFSNTVGIKFGV
jgi:Pentapeptide repeats (8 copies)